MSGHTILVSVDKSQQSEYAFNYYLKVLYKPDHKLIFLHVDELPTNPEQAMARGFSGGGLREEVEREEKETKELFQKYREAASKKGATGIEEVIKPGIRAGEIITSVAEERKVDAVVMGTRGMGVIRRTILGSVSDYVLHHAHCPVIICRQ